MEDYGKIGARALDHVRKLSVDIGPRGSCTAAERRGSEYAAGVMRKWGAEARVEPFTCCSTYSLPWGLVGLLLVFSAVLVWFSPLAALIVAVVNLPIYYLLAAGRGEVGLLFPRRPSQNVWAKAPARGPGPAARRVALVAHVDTTRAALLYAPSQLKRLRASHVINQVAVTSAFATTGIWGAGAALAALMAGSGTAGETMAAFARGAVWVARILGAVFGVVAAYGLLTLIHRQLFMPYVAGANDNASGVGLALALGERLAEKPLSRTEVWCVVTGAEETGYPAGAKRFVDRHLAELRDAEVLILDNLGAGDLRHLTEEGIISPLKMDRGLLALARRTGRGHPDWNVRDSVCNLGYTDGTAAITAGLRTLVLWAEGPDGLLVNYHWPTDTFENVRPETISRAAAFVMEMLEAIDRDEDRRPV